MKIHKLSVVIFLSLYSCTSSPIQNISPSNSMQSISSVVPSSQTLITPNPSVSVVLSKTPEPEISPSSIPSLTPNIKNIRIVSDDNNVMGQYLYNILPNEKKQFNAYFEEINKFKNDEVIWTSSNPEIASIDQNGLVVTTNHSKRSDIPLIKDRYDLLIGYTNIKASLKSNPDIYTSFVVRLYSSFEYSYQRGDVLCKEPVRNGNLSRFEEINTGETTLIVDERSKISGKVYDKNNNLLDDVTISVNIADKFGMYSEMICTEISQKTINNSYSFNDIFTGTQIIITASKEGYISKSRKVVTKSNLTGDPNANVFNFGGDNQSDSEFALEKVKN